MTYSTTATRALIIILVVIIVLLIIVFLFQLKKITLKTAPKKSKPPFISFRFSCVYGICEGKVRTQMDKIGYKISNMGI